MLDFVKIEVPPTGCLQGQRGYLRVQFKRAELFKRVGIRSNDTQRGHILTVPLVLDGGQLDLELSDVLGRVGLILALRPQRYWSLDLFGRRLALSRALQRCSYLSLIERQFLWLLHFLLVLYGCLFVIVSRRVKAAVGVASIVLHQHFLL